VKLTMTDPMFRKWWERGAQALTLLIGVGFIAAASASVNGRSTAAAVTVTAALALSAVVVTAVLAMQFAEEAYREAIPDVADWGGCTQCNASFIGAETLNGDGIIVWHSSGCVEGARVELRLEAKVP
jgi:hypothetical protein